MKIQRLYIGDFGILRNQSLIDIHPGMVVIGGHNRAGKSTLMQVLRYLGYGFPKGGNLPPSSNSYEAEADIVMATGDVYNLRLKGYGQPSLKRMSGSQEEIMTAEELYGLDDYTYGQLFTISLDELTGTHGKTSDEKRKLQSILLGAGFSDMLLIPQLKDEFRKEGEKIGGKRGNPTVKLFKPYSQKIESGQRQRQKGLAQVSKYRETKDELKSKEGTILRLRHEVEPLNDEIIRLDLVKNNYDTYLRMEELRQALHNSESHRWAEHPSRDEVERLEELRSSFQNLKWELRDREMVEGIDVHQREILIGQKDELFRYRADISGIEERLRQYSEGVLDYERKKQGIETAIRETYGSCDHKDFESISEIRTDEVKHHELSEMVENHKELKRDYKNKLEDLDNKKEQYRILKENLKEDKGNKPYEGVKKYFYSSLAFTVIGIILLFINPLPGIIIGVGGALGVATHLILSSRESKETQRLIHGERDRLKNLGAEIFSEEESLAKLKEEIDAIEDKLENGARRIGLDPDAAYGLLPNHLLRLRDIQNRIEELKVLSQKLYKAKTQLNGAYANYSKFIRSLGGEVHSEEGIDAGYRPEDWHRINVELKKLEDYLEGALDLRFLEQKIEALEKEIGTIIVKYEPHCRFMGTDEEILQFIDRANKAMEYSKLEGELKHAEQSILISMRSDGIKRAFALEDADTEDPSGAMNPLRAFHKACSVYSSQDEAQGDYRRLVEERDKNLRDLDELNKGKQRLENELEALKAMDNLVEGQRQIHSGRAGLESLGDTYALNMAAAFMLEEAERNLLDGMRDTLMDSAGNIFNRMTGGQYRGILPSDRILESDFEAVPEGDIVPQTVDMLSRGTKEQLYLSVRLSRIMDIKPCLPVIIDDSLANFDSMHLGQSLDILWELSKTHQIFILTCHKDLVGEIANYVGEAQYWKLDRGRLELSEGQKLMEYLS